MNPEFLITAEQRGYEKVEESTFREREREADPIICWVLWFNCVLLLGEVWKIKRKSLTEKE